MGKSRIFREDPELKRMIGRNWLIELILILMAMGVLAAFAIQFLGLWPGIASLVSFVLAAAGVQLPTYLTFKQITVGDHQIIPLYKGDDHLMRVLLPGKHRIRRRYQAGTPIDTGLMYHQLSVANVRSTDGIIHSINAHYKAYLSIDHVAIKKLPRMVRIFSDPQSVGKLINRTLEDVIREVCGGRSVHALNSGSQSAILRNEIRQAVQNRLMRFGIQMAHVHLGAIVPPTDVQDALTQLYVCQLQAQAAVSEVDRMHETMDRYPQYEQRTLTQAFFHSRIFGPGGDLGRNYGWAQ